MKIILDFPEDRPSMDNFEEDLKDLVYSYGEKSQDGIKDALKKAQDFFGCVDGQCQNLIAEAFNIDKTVVKTLMKFISSIKEEVVACEVVCCTGPRCAKNGSMEVIRSVKDSLGLDFNETSNDGQIRLTTKNCFKKCGEGPNIKVNDDFFHEMDKNKATSLMNKVINEYTKNT